MMVNQTGHMIMSLRFNIMRFPQKGERPLVDEAYCQEVPNRLV